MHQMASKSELWNILTILLPLAILAHLMLTHTTSQHFNQNLNPQHQLMSTAVYLACITCQLCSLIYHTFNSSVSPRAARTLYCLDLAGVCCMSLGSPWLYATGVGTGGLGVYVGVLFACTAWCLFLLLRAAFRDQDTATCERWIMLLSAIGNYPALARPTTAAATVTILGGYIVFYRLRFPESVFPAARGKASASHALWHCVVFAGQLVFVNSTNHYTAP